MHPFTTGAPQAGFPVLSSYTNLPHKLVLIPHWIETACIRHNVELSNVIYFDKIKDIVPQYDLAAMASLTAIRFLGLMGLDNAEFSYDFTNPLFLWSNGYPAGSQENRDLFNTIAPLSDSAEMINDTYERLFVQKRIDLDPELTFKIVEVKENHLGIVIYPGYFTGDQGPIFTFLDRLMRTQFQHHPLHVLAQRPVFRRYLSLLGKSSTAA
jgi:hypothetical protein